MSGRLAAVGRLARTALVYEIGMWRSLLRWIARRPVVGGGTAFSYAGVVTPVIWAFIAVSAIEVPVLHLLLPWEAVRLAADVVGVYGLLWMVGMLASLKVHPHVVEDDGLRVRNGTTLDVLLRWEDVAAVRQRMRSLEGMRNVQVAGEGADRVLSVGVGSQTNVDVELREPLVLPVRRTEGRPVAVVRLYADDPKALAARLRAELSARAAS
ncbi:PH domain-containing protein [Geodermatophilus sp. SYSU D00815]